MSNAGPVPPIAPPPVEPSPRIPRRQIEELFKTVSGVQVWWTTRAHPELGRRPLTERAWLTLTATRIVHHAVDELRQQYDSTANKNDNFLRGERTVTLAVGAWSGTGTLEAVDLLERVNYRLRTQFARSLMVPTICLRTIGPILGLPGEAVEKRELMRATCDVRLGYVLGQDPLDPGDYIEEVDGGGIIPITLE